MGGTGGNTVVVFVVVVGWKWVGGAGLGVAGRLVECAVGLR